MIEKLIIIDSSTMNEQNNGAPNFIITYIILFSLRIAILKIDYNYVSTTKKGVMAHKINQDVSASALSRSPN